MEFDEWEPVYEKILDAFGYDRTADERARDLLAAVFADTSVADLGCLDFSGKTVAIAAPAATLEDELTLVRDADAVVAVSAAGTHLRNAGIDIDCLVTDLDKEPATARRLSKAGIPVAVHAHGDNIATLEDVVPSFTSEAVIPTTQARPVAPLVNVGGFTDGDRAAFLADAVGAERLVFPGWDFDDPDVEPEKRQKLTWAARLLCWLERRRDERFELLDGCRSTLDLSLFEPR